MVFWCFRRAEPKALATTRCSCPIITPALSARWIVPRNTDCRRKAKDCHIGRAPSSCSRRPALPSNEAQAVSGLPAAKPFGVYVHWPFCLSKCPYCDFNSHVRHGGIDEERFVRAFSAEVAAIAARVPGRTVSTIFLGGGTPSL